MLFGNEMWVSLIELMCPVIVNSSLSRGLQFHTRDVQSVRCLVGTLSQSYDYTLLCMTHKMNVVKTTI